MKQHPIACHCVPAGSAAAWQGKSGLLSRARPVPASAAAQRACCRMACVHDQILPMTNPLPLHLLMLDRSAIATVHVHTLDCLGPPTFHHAPPFACHVTSRSI